MARTTTPTRKAGTAKAPATKATKAQPKRAPRQAQAKETEIDPFLEKQGQQIAVGGAAGVPIIMEALPAIGYSPRAVKEEEYPFSKLDNCRKVGDAIVGPSFFIPDTAKPDRHLATARKRHRPGQTRFEVMKFFTRRDVQEIGGKPVPGIKVWRATAEDEQAWIAEVLADEKKAEKEAA